MLLGMVCRVLPAAMVTVSKRGVLAKADPPMLLTEAGILTVASLLQPLKAETPIVVTPSPMVRVSNLEQPLKRSFAIEAQ